jgi:glycine oxidase
MATRAPADLVVVGGGVIGLTIAWEAAGAGLAVIVVDPRPGHGASWAAAGMLAPAGEAQFGEEALCALNRVASRSWPEFARRLEAATGESIDYVAEGSLLVAVDPSDRQASDDVLDFQLGLGLDARRLSARECRALEPMLSPAIRGGVELAEDHRVDNRRLIGALLRGCRRLGVGFVDDEASGVEIDRRRVTGVGLRAGGRRDGRAVVVAAGCHSGQLGGIPAAIRPPVRPVKGLTLRLRRADRVPPLRRTVRGLVHGRKCYIVPRADGTVVVGATVEEKGFDLTVQVGPVGDLLEDARRLIPSLEEYVLEETSTGLRPGSPDNAPLVGATRVGGLVVATGHYRNGILLAPLTAGEVVRIVIADAGGGPSADAAGSHPDTPFTPFGPDRFAPVDHHGTRPGGDPAPVRSPR